jgi:hypothetical protein
MKIVDRDKNMAVRCLLLPRTVISEFILMIRSLRPLHANQTVAENLQAGTDAIRVDKLP